MTRYHRKPRRPRRHKKRLPFWKAATKYGFRRALKYEIDHSRRYPLYPIWFFPTIILMFLIAIILMNYYIDFLPIIFYISEVIVVGYLAIRLLKRLDRIRIKRRNHLRLFGLRILSGLVSIFGIFLLIFTWISFPIAQFESLFNQETIFTRIVTFGSQWQEVFPILFLFF